jgi:hypothetical protein
MPEKQSNSEDIYYHSLYPIYHFEKAEYAMNVWYELLRQAQVFRRKMAGKIGFHPILPAIFLLKT